ncbi:MAG: glycosyltransferase family 2 protein, partial [Flavobacteriales bacterium]|nr:glycosyltransferase family 2 protein [Flavobacteriales bacterium]
MSTKLSIIILTYNEADVLARTMQAAAQVADELVIVDSHSTDNTLNVAKKNGATKIEVRDFENWADQRNWAMEQSTYPWVLFIDADEVMDERLIQALLQWKSDLHTDKAAFWGLRRSHFFMGRAMRFSGLQSDVVVRLFHHTRRYNDCAVHEKIDVPKPKPLPGILEHYTYKDWEKWADKQRGYAKRSAKDYQDK